MSTITEPLVGTGLPRSRAPTHPGELLREDFIDAEGRTQTDIAAVLGIPLNRLNEVVTGKRGITADTALRLEKAFGASAQYWLNLQAAWDLYRAKQLALKASARRPAKAGSKKTPQMTVARRATTPRPRQPETARRIRAAKGKKARHPRNKI